VFLPNHNKQTRTTQVEASSPAGTPLRESHPLQTTVAAHEQAFQNCDAVCSTCCQDLNVTRPIYEMLLAYVCI
jgi:hypothetical protein